MAQKASSTESTNTKAYTKKELSAFLDDIENSIVEGKGNHLHALLALNHLLRLPAMEKQLDKNLKNHAKELWVKIKAKGFQLADPPVLFGLPSDFKEDHLETNGEATGQVKSEKEIKVTDKSKSKTKPAKKEESE